MNTYRETIENNEAIEILDGEEEPNVRSTKRPIIQKGEKQTKRQKREKQEETLLQKAIACMEGASDNHSAMRDVDSVFGEYIASELRAMKNQEMKCWVKHRIQSLIFSAQSRSMGFPQPTEEIFPQQFPPNIMRPPWDYAKSGSGNDWTSTPCRTPSTSSIGGNYSAEHDEFSSSNYDS